MKVSFYLTRPYSGERVHNKKAGEEKRKLNEGQSGIYASICYSGNKIKYYLNETIYPKFWDFKAKCAKRRSDFREWPEFNARLDNTATKIKNVFRTYCNDNNGHEPTPAVLQNLLNRGFNKSAAEAQQERLLKTFWGFFDDFIKRCEDGVRVHHKTDTPLAKGTINNFRNLKRHLEEFERFHRRKIDFETIDLKFHQSFTGYLTTQKKLGVNFVGKQITHLKVILREAFEMGFNKNTTYTHSRFKSSQKDTETIYFTEAEITELQSLDLTDKKRLDRVRDLFIIGCYTGLRYSDLSKLSRDHIKNDIIEIEQTKTKEKVFIPVRPIVADLIAKYGGELPKAISNQKFNEYLQEVCSMAEGLQKDWSIAIYKGGQKVTETKPKYTFVSSHTARRTFATLEYLAGDLQTFEIRAITGHKTDKSFYRYIRQTPKENAANVAKKWQEREAKRMSVVPHLKAV